MDGSSVTHIVTQDILNPKALAIDYNSRFIVYKSVSKNPNFRVSDQDIPEPACSAAGTGLKIKI